MKKTVMALAALLALAAPPARAEVSVSVKDDDFAVVLKDLSLEAEADLGGFEARLSADFGKSKTSVKAVLKSVDSPADAYMVLRVAQVADKPVDDVLAAYRADKKKGWGRIARGLGIKPGSAEFHALKKRGGSAAASKGGESRGKGKGKGKGKEKGGGKGKGKGRG